MNQAATSICGCPVPAPTDRRTNTLSCLHVPVVAYLQSGPTVPSSVRLAAAHAPTPPNMALVKPQLPQETFLSRVFLLCFPPSFLPPPLPLACRSPSVGLRGGASVVDPPGPGRVSLYVSLTFLLGREPTFVSGVVLSVINDSCSSCL